MPMVPSHAIAGLTVGIIASRDRWLWIAAALCAALPDADVLLMHYADVAYEDPWGHRGISHGLPFAAALAALVGCSLFPGRRWRASLVIFFATASQGVLDAMTDGGLGVAFFSPFSYERFFLPWRPIPVAPLSVEAAFTASAVRLWLWEIAFVWGPCLGLLGLLRLVRRGGPPPRGGGKQQGDEGRSTD